MTCKGYEAVLRKKERTTLYHCMDLQVLRTCKCMNTHCVFIPVKGVLYMNLL